MNTVLILAVLAVLGIWFVVGRSMWRSGPGRWQHIVRCPKNDLPAKLLVEQKEGDFGSLVMADVARCSLFPDRQPLCRKECLSRL